MEHFKKNCLKRKDKGEKEKTFNDVNIASEGKIFDDVEIVLVVFVSSLGDGWILYSTYTYHIFLNKSLFDTYKFVNGTLLLIDNKRIVVVGKGTIWIRMCDGIVRTLKVQHILEIKKT